MKLKFVSFLPDMVGEEVTLSDHHIFQLMPIVVRLLLKNIIISSLSIIVKKPFVS